MSRLILWRHGQTAWNSIGRMQGQTDIDMDATGHAQAAAGAELLAAMGPAKIVSSDLRRCYDTAVHLAELTGLPVTTDKRLRERSFGDWEGMTGTEVAERYPSDWELWSTGQPLHGHGIEDYDAVAVRMHAAITDAVADCDGLVVVVTHGGSSRRALAALIGVPGFSEAIGGLYNCRWTELRQRNGVWKLHAHNVGEPVGATPPGQGVQEAGNRARGAHV
ncbi:phosphoglycerate mutase [Longispora fulva]|uniref:Putative phosphoglycerate mutase n=1 Tax=Longispora fulva TaxID=619741 RepID=A0A8J7KNZ6_9ACTN|nr:histidine phosphatase family protein [Longispora fulva]MBG6140796.1 putative phosphoglycerate mutase [Longispora fulva]GIG60940.1 phosphoglycerate mutase [Longispora fulva]